MWESMVMALVTATMMLQASWSYRVEWEHDGNNVTHFQLCVDNDCQSVSATRGSGTQTWSAPVPVLSVGMHTLSISACNSRSCTAGSPAISVNVTPGPIISNPPTTPPPTPPPTNPPSRRAPPRRPPKT
jgi:hypothetical protein